MMKFIYILTDCNRKNLLVGLTEDPLATAISFKNYGKHVFAGPAFASRIVYVESYATEEMARNRLHLLGTYTRSQKERLIRARNRDWKDLYTATGINQLPCVSLSTQFAR